MFPGSTCILYTRSCKSTQICILPYTHRYTICFRINPRQNRHMQYTHAIRTCSAVRSCRSWGLRFGLLLRLVWGPVLEHDALMIILVAKAKQRAIRSWPWTMISAQSAKSTTRPKQVRSVRRQSAIRNCTKTWPLAAKSNVRANVSVLGFTVRIDVLGLALHTRLWAWDLVNSRSLCFGQNYDSD